MTLTINSGSLTVKDPDSIEEFTVDWTARLSAGALIASSIFTITGPDVALTQSNAVVLAGNLSTGVFLSGGTLGRLYTVTNEIVTNESPAQTLDASFRIKIEQQ
jgi:hypothetical protein